jgi:hypothetical protein
LQRRLRKQLSRLKPFFTIQIIFRKLTVSIFRTTSSMSFLEKLLTCSWTSRTQTKETLLFWTRALFTQPLEGKPMI